MHSLYEFGDFALDVGQQRLLRRDTGIAVALAGKSFDTLVYLVEHAGESLDKDTLLRSIWQDVIVEENSLAQAISNIRQALGESRGDNRYIATLPRKGYQFVARVTRSELPASTAATSASTSMPVSASPLRPRSRKVIAWVGVLLVSFATFSWLFGESASRKISPAATAGIAASQTLAILPFKPLIPAQRNESIELGMADSLISRLSQSGPGRISPLSSVRRYAALEQDPIQAGRELRVDTVLDGSIQRSGDRLKVSVRLLRVSDERQLWTQSFNQPFTTIFDVQDTIAAEIARELSGRLTARDLTHRIYHPRDPEAFTLYSSGKIAWTRSTEPSLLQGINFFQQAIARDPNYALAYAGLADCYANLGVFGMRAPQEAFPAALAAVNQALSLDPDLAEAHATLGHIKVQYEHDWEGAAREFARAIQLNPSLAPAYNWRALLYAMQGDIDQAIEKSQRAQQLEPLWLSPKAVMGNILYYWKRHDEAIRILDQVLEVENRADNARSFLIRNLIGKGDYRRALLETDKHPLTAPGSYAFRGQILALSGRRAEALVELNRVLKLATQRYVAAYDIALIYAALDDRENAILWLNRAVKDRSTLINFVGEDPMFDALHNDPRFHSLVQTIGIHGRVLP